MKINFQDIQFGLHCNVDVEFKVAPVDRHNMNGNDVLSDILYRKY